MLKIKKNYIPEKIINIFSNWEVQLENESEVFDFDSDLHQSLRDALTNNYLTTSMHAHIYDHAMENINLIQSIPEEIPALNQITAESIAVVLFLNDRGES